MNLKNNNSDEMSKDEKEKNWIKIEDFLRQSLENLILSPVDSLQEVTNFLDHNELGLAFETIIDILDERNIKLSKNAYEYLKKAGDAMGFNSENNLRYKLLVTKFKI